MRWTDTAKKFLGAFASKDVAAIESLLDEDVRLINWSCDVKGVGDTINAIENFFDFVKNIRIHIMNTAYHNKYVCMELEVTYTTTFTESVNKTVVANIAYIMEFTDWGKVKSMRVYNMHFRHNITEVEDGDTN